MKNLLGVSFFSIMPYVSTLPQPSIVINSPLYRDRILHGKKYWIIPGVILVADVVMNGALVPEEEMSMFVEAWNGRPITIDHPENSYEGASTPNPDAPIVGTFYHSRWDEEGRRVKGEFWLDVNELSKTDTGRTIIKNIKAGNLLNVSTGYWAEFELVEGEEKGKEYRVVHRNIRPDHIAILLADNGACSLDDGCGLGVNRDTSTDCKSCKLHKKEAIMPNRKFKIADLKKLLPGIFANEDDEVEIEFDPAELLSDSDRKKLTSPEANSDKSKGKEKTTPPAGAESELPSEIIEFASALKSIGGADGFKQMMAGAQVAAKFAQNMQKQEEQEKAVLIKNIKATGQSVYTDEELQSLEVSALQKLAQFVGAEVNFMGQSAYVSNSEAYSEEDAFMEMPDMLSFGKKED